MDEKPNTPAAIFTGETDHLRIKPAAPVSRFTDEALDDIFSYHPPEPSQLAKYNEIRGAAGYFARVLIANTPPSGDQTTAIRKLRECVAVANAAVALKGKY